jgi:hypothetical protein
MIRTNDLLISVTVFDCFARQMINYPITIINQRCLQFNTRIEQGQNFEIPERYYVPNSEMIQYKHKSPKSRLYYIIILLYYTSQLSLSALHEWVFSTS